MTSHDPEDAPPSPPPGPPPADPPPFAPPPRPVFGPDFGSDVEPAPVVTDEGTFGHIPEPEPLLDDDEGWARPLFARLATWLLVLVAAAWLVVLGGWQVTGRAVATPAIERAVASLGQIDSLLTMHHDAIVAAGAGNAANPAARIAIPGFPVPAATLTALEARDGSTAALRALVLGRAAKAIYADGTAALVGPDGTPTHAAIFSTAGATRRLLAALTAANHDRLAALLWPLGIAAAALAAAGLGLGRGFGRFVALGRRAARRGGADARRDARRARRGRRDRHRRQRAGGGDLRHHEDAAVDARARRRLARAGRRRDRAAGDDRGARGGAPRSRRGGARRADARPWHEVGTRVER